MKKKKSGIGTKLLMAALFLGVAGYFGIQAFQYLDDPLGVTLAYRYEVEQAVDMTGFVVREERVLPDEGGGLLRIQRAEGERVSAGGTVASVYADQASLDRQAEIDSLESRVEQLQYAQNLALAAETTRKLDAQITQNLLSYRQYLTAGRLYDAEGAALELRALVLKRDYSGGSGDLSAQLQELGAQLLSLRSQSEGSVRRITSPESGLYSAEVDGYETVLTPALLESLTPSQLSELTADPATVSRVGKLILGTDWYYAATLSAKDAMALQDRQSELGELSLRFSQGVNRDLPVTLESVGATEKGQVVAVFRGNSYLQELTLLRQQRAQVVTGTTQGIRVLKESLRAERSYLDESGALVTEAATGIYCLVGREARFKPVEVVYSGDGFVLVRPTSTKEAYTLRSGEQVILSARGLFDGKVLLD